MQVSALCAAGDEGTQRSRWCQSVISRPSGTVTDACNVGLYEDQYSGHGPKHGLVLSETRWLRVVYSRLKKYARSYKGHLETTVGQTMVDGYITASLYVGTTDVVKDYAGARVCSDKKRTSLLGSVAAPSRLRLKKEKLSARNENYLQHCLKWNQI